MRAVAVVLAVSVVFAGGIIAGTAPITRQPAPYDPGIAEAPYDPESIAASDWAVNTLGPGRRFIGDSAGGVLIGSVGRQRLVTSEDGVSVSAILLSPGFNDNERTILKDGRIRYVLVDRRIAGTEPMKGFIYEKWERELFDYGSSVTSETVNKFDVMRNASKQFDSGNVQIFELQRLTTMSRNRAVFMLAIFTALCAAVLMFVNVGFVWLRVLIGVPFVLLLPGSGPAAVRRSRRAARWFRVVRAHGRREYQPHDLGGNGTGRVALGAERRLPGGRPRIRGAAGAHRRAHAGRPSGAAAPGPELPLLHQARFPRSCGAHRLCASGPAALDSRVSGCRGVATWSSSGGCPTSRAGFVSAPTTSTPPRRTTA